MQGKSSFNKLMVITLTCAYVFVTLYTLINLPSVTAFFSAILSVLSPIIIGAAIAYILNPLLKLFEFKVFKKIQSKKLLRALSLVLTYVTALVVIIGFLALILPSVVRSLMDLGSNLGTYLVSTVEYLNILIVRFTDNSNLSDFVSTDALTSFIAKVFSFSDNVLDTVMAYLQKYGPTIFTGFKNFLLGLFISVYILASKERIKAQTRKISIALFRPATRKRLRKYFHTVHRTFGDFFVGKLIDSFIIFLICLVAFSIAGIKYSALIALIIGMANIIPVFGPFIGAVPAFFIIFIVDIRKAIVFLILILIIQVIDGNIIAPKILGDSTGISSLGVIVAIVIGSYFKIVGMLVAIPVFAIITAIIRDLANARLKKNGQPVSSAEYYSDDSFAELHEPHETIMHRLFKGIKNKFAKTSKSSDPNMDDDEKCENKDSASENNSASDKEENDG